MRQSLARAAGETAAVSGAPAVGAEPLLQLLKSYSRSDGLKTSITVGMYPVSCVGMCDHMLPTPERALVPSVVSNQRGM